jgi:MoxR-like ATPase
MEGPPKETRTMRTCLVDDIPLLLARPADLPLSWVGREDLVHQLLAAWMVLDPGDRPMSPRLVGRPGVGKTTLAWAAAKRLGRDVYLFQATMDTRPEDLVVTPVVGPEGKILYVGSALVTAAIRGGVCILDEGNRMSEKSWASLAPLLDDRRYVESAVAGIRVEAHPDFRFVVTVNEDSSTYEIPEYIHSRLQPQIFVDFPERSEEEAILRANVPQAPADVLRYVTSFLQACHRADEPYGVRDGLNVARYALRLAGTFGGTPLSHVHRAVESAVGTDALRHLPDREILR